MKTTALLSKVETTYGLSKMQQGILWGIVSPMARKDRCSMWVFSLINGRKYRSIERNTNEEKPRGWSAFERRLAEIEGRVIKKQEVKFVPHSLQKRMAREFVRKHITFTGSFTSVLSEMKAFETALVKAFTIWCEE